MATATTPTTVAAGLAWTTLATSQKYVVVKMEGRGVLEIVLDDTPPAATAGRKGFVLDSAEGGVAEFGDVESAIIYARPLDTDDDKDIEVTVISHTPV